MFRQRRAQEQYWDRDENWSERKAWPLFLAIVFVAFAPIWLVLTTPPPPSATNKPNASDFKNPNREFAQEISQIERELNPYLTDPKHHATSSSMAKKYSDRNQRIIEAAEAAEERS